MAWIKTIPPAEADPALKAALDFQATLYPIEYATPVNPQASGAPGIVGAHSLLPAALKHIFAAFGELMSPALPLSRAQHEMISTVVSATNRCRY